SGEHAIPRHRVPEMICHIIGERLGIDVTVADIGMVRGEAADRQPSLAGAIDRAAALWHGDARGCTPTALISGAKAAAPIWEWENPPEDDHIARIGEHRVDPVDVAMLRRARAHYQEMYRQEESGRTADVTHLRGQAHRYAGLALILGAQGDLDRSVHIAGQMLDRAEGMESGRIHDRIAHVARVLRPHATEPNVAAFLERADECLPL